MGGQDVSVVPAQPIQQRRRKLLVAEDLNPLSESEVGGDHRRAHLVALREQIEEKLAPGPLERDEAKLVEDQKIDPADAPVQRREGALVAGLGQHPNQVRSPVEGDLVAPAGRLDPCSYRDVSLDGAKRMPS